MMSITSFFHVVVTCHLFYVVMTTKTLYIGGLFNLGKVESWQVIPAAQLAIEVINNSSSFLPGYRLALLINDTRDNDLKTASGVQSYLNNGPQKIMLLGSLNNDEAKSIAYYTGLPQYGLLQFSLGTNDLSLSSDRHSYPYFFRTDISMETFDGLRIAFIEHFKWKEVGIVHGDNLLDAQLSNALKRSLENKGIKVLAEVRLEENDAGRAIRTIEEKDIHVIFGLISMDVAARKLFCQAYKSGLYGPHYVWILQMADNNGWWVPQSGEDIGGCKEIEMTCQVQNYFSLKSTYGFDKNVNYSLSTKTTSQLVSDYNLRVDNGSIISNRSNDAWLAYDAVWSIAHVLKNSRVQLTIQNITYGDTMATTIFYNETLKLNLDSPNMKHLRYLTNGNRKFDMNIEQIVIKDGNSNPTSNNAGSYDYSTEMFRKDTINWQAGTPYRKTINSYVTRSIHRALFGALIFLACLGLLYAVVCLIVVVIYRKQPIIWNSGPIINTIIILGCILNYITVILYAFDWTTTSRVTSLCRARAWTFAIGFTLSVGGLVAKLWIAYCVLSERFVRRWRNMLIWMLVIVLVLFIFDLIIIGCWEGIDPLTAKNSVYKDQETYKCFQPITEKTFQAVWYTVEHCACNHTLLWLLIILILKFLVVLFGVFLAWQTRKLYIKSLNDTQHCGFCIFVVLFFGIFGVLCGLLSTKLPNLFFALVGGFLFLCTTIILGLLYIHKIGRVMCKPRSRGAKTILVGSKDDSHESEKNSSCFSCCSCCSCSAVCCIAFCSCFPCCNMYTCCRKCCCGTQVHPSKGDDKTEFYINGQPQEKEGQIAYLLRILHERDEELAKLRPGYTLTSMWTQTYDEDFDDDDDDGSDWEHEDGDGSSMNGDGGSSDNSKRSRRKKRKIFNKGADYSHIRSKVDSGVVKSPPRTPRKKKDEKYYLGVWQANGGKATDAEIAKLKAQLAEKDKEIENLKKGSKNPSTTITIINEEGKSQNTKEKQCQTDDHSPIEKKNSVVVIKSPSSSNNSTPRKATKSRKASKHESPEKVIIVKQNDKKDIKKEEEQPVQANAMWLFGKQDEKDIKTGDEDVKKKDTQPSSTEKRKEDKKTDVVVILPEKDKKEEAKQDKGNAINVVVVASKPDDKEEKEKEKEKLEQQRKDDEEKRKQAGREEKRKEKEKQEEEQKEKEKQEEEQKEKEKQEEEERKEKEKQQEEQKEKDNKEEEEERKKQEEEENKKQEKERQEKRKSRFSFFGRKDSLPVDHKPKEEEQSASNTETNENPTTPKQDKPESPKPDKPESPKPDKPESPKPSNPESPKQDKPESPEPGKPEPSKHDKPEAPKPDKPEAPKSDKPESPEPGKPESPKLDKPESPTQNKPESPKPDKPDDPVKPANAPKDTDDEEQEKLDSKPEDQSKTGKSKPQKEERAQDDFDEEESHPIRPPQNTPASVGRPQEEPVKKDDEKTKKLEEPTKAGNKSNGEKTSDHETEPSDETEKIEEEIEDDDDGSNGDDQNANSDDDGHDDTNGDDDDDDDNKNDDKNEDKKKPKRKTRKKVGGKLNWNAESKIDNSSGYKKRPTKKIKTYKVDYSHVRSKYRSPGDNTEEKKDENINIERRKPRKRAQRKSRWNPSSQEKAS